MKKVFIIFSVKDHNRGKTLGVVLTEKRAKQVIRRLYPAQYMEAERL